MRQIFTVDVSSWQRPVDERYDRKWFIFRCCDGSYSDPVCVVNKSWAERALREGRILGWTAYVVYRPGKVAAILNEVAMLPAGGHVMIDVESWNGQIRGDHSDEINRLALELQKRFPGELIAGLPRAWRYGNRGDLDSLHPRNVLNLPTFVAAYGTVKPSDPNLIGWQYTDGSGRWPVPSGWPRSSAPFGPCDHDVLYLPTVAPPAPVPPIVTTESEGPDEMFIIYPSGNHDVKALLTGAGATFLRDGVSVASLRAAGVKQVEFSDRDFDAVTAGASE